MHPFKALDSISLKAFYYSSITLNFTKAAELAALTQSGVSQHIAKLESELGSKLFIRSGRKLILSSTGIHLKHYVLNYLNLTEVMFNEIQKVDSEICGMVKYAMPDSCLMSPHFSQLLDEIKDFSTLSLNVEICHSDVVIDLVLNGDIDFGFVTKKVENKNIESKIFAEELHSLVSTFKKHPIDNVRDFKKMKFINYPGMVDLYYNWFHLEFPNEKPIPFSDLNLAGEINSLRGAITMVSKGVGCSIFPEHCISSLMNEKKLFKISNHKDNKHNSIYLIQLKNKIQPLKVKSVIQNFWKIKN